MATKKYDVAVKTGSYEKDGETKNRYENVGSIFQGEHGPYLVLKRSFNPAGVPFKEGSDSILLSLFEPKEKESGGSRPASQPKPAPQQQRKTDDFKDDIPF